MSAHVYLSLCGYVFVRKCISVLVSVCMSLCVYVCVYVLCVSVSVVEESVLVAHPCVHIRDQNSAGL